MEDAIPGERDASSVGLRKRCAAKRKPQISDWKPEVFYMPAVGLEPTRCCHQQILSLPRLPIPARTNIILTYERRICKLFYDFGNRTFGSLTEVIIYDNFRIHEHDL